MLLSAADPLSYSIKYFSNLFVTCTAEEDSGLLSFFNSKLVPGIYLICPLLPAYIAVSRRVVKGGKNRASPHRFCPAGIVNNPVSRLKPPVFLKLFPFFVDCLITGQEVIGILCNNLGHPDRAFIKFG